MGLGERWRTRLVHAIRDVLPPRVREFVVELSEEDVLLHAAGLAFYALVSVAPLTIVAMWITSLVAGDDRIQRMADTLASITPKNVGADTALKRVAETGTSLGVAALIGGLWPATAYGSGLARALRRMSPKDPPQELRGLWGRVLVLVVLLPLLVFGTIVSAFAATSLFEEGFLRVAGWALALAVSFLGAGAAAALIYRVFPPETLPWRRVVKGAAASALGVALLTLGYVLLIGMGADFQQRYAVSGLAGVVLLGVWLFLANALLLVGYRMIRPRS